MFLFIFTLFVSFSFTQSELPDRYTTYQEIEQQLNDWSEEFGSNTDPYPFYPGEEGIIYHHEIIGYSAVENLPIWAVKLAMNADVNEDKPKVLILGQCHAEEIYGVEIAMELINWMLYPMNHTAYIQSILAIMNNAEIWIVPSHNPDGLNVVHGWYDDLNQWNQDVTYRKNKYDANGNGLFDFIIGPGEDLDGVDLNRNYDFNWIFGDGIDQLDSGGCNPSYLTNYDYYRGPHPFSESEVVAIKNFVESKNFLLSIAYHSSRSGCVAEKVIYPWEWTEEKASPDYDVISRLGIEIANMLPKEAESGSYYPVGSQSRKGNAHDWIYANTGCFQYLIEVGSENIQPNDVDLINTTVGRNVLGAMHLLKRAAGTNIQNGPDVYQITGIVKDQSTGIPITAEVSIDEMNGPMLKPRFTDEFGRYRRLLVEGTYTINFDAYGYESQSYTFVPSSSQATVYDVELVPLSESELILDFSFPDDYYSNEFVDVTVISENNEQFHTFINGQNSLNLPHGLYKIIVEGNDLFPEIIDFFDFSQNMTFQFDLKWKAMQRLYDFENDNAWDYNGLITISNGKARSQATSFYSGMINNTMTSNDSFSSGDYVIELDMKYEFEWDYDSLAMFSSCDGCLNEYLKVFSDHSWNGVNDLIPFPVDEGEMRKLNFNIITDEELYYRGFEINQINILYKPESDCAVGDVVLDGYINVVDIIQMVNIILDDNSTAFENCTADLNNDDTINVSDITLTIENITGD